MGTVLEKNETFFDLDETLDAIKGIFANSNGDCVSFNDNDGHSRDSKDANVNSIDNRGLSGDNRIS